MMGFLDKVKNALGSSENFKYLDNLIHSGVKEIVLDSDIIFSRRDESEYLEGIKLDVDGLVIDGCGYTIDAKGKSRIFYCTGKNVIIKNIILKNGFSKDSNGGAILNEGELIIMSSRLTENMVQKGSGGAIDNKGKLTVFESALNNNTVQGKYSSNCGGAIINREGCVLSITESTLTGNKANNGGAILNGGRLTIIESTLVENTSNDVGGAIKNDGGVLSITESTITRNTAKREGGAIYNPVGELTITSSTLTRNIARWGGVIHNTGKFTITKSTLQENTAWKKGGAILNGGELTITESLLIGNSASHGGAINNWGDNFKIFNCEFSNNESPNNIILNEDSLQIHNSIFKDNQSKYIVLNESDGSNLGIFNGEFSENNVEKSVLCNVGKFCSIEKTVFQNNISNNSMNIINESELTLINPQIKDKGKSILNQNYILIRKSSPELENTICGEGTVETIENRIPQGETFDFGYLDKKIHESNTQEIILDHDIIFENYEIDFYEGGIELDIDDLVIDGNGHIIDGADKSRIFIITRKNITLKNIVFKNGHSHKNYDNPLNNNGGAIRINHNGNLTIENCEFINNTSEEEGGAIYNSGELTITESTLTGNTAKYDGGAIYNRGELTITDSTLTENTAQKYGGAIYNTGELTITESILTENTAQEGSGGAICLKESTKKYESENCTFKDNKPDDVYEEKD